MRNESMLHHACPHCGAELPTEASFCPHCAQSVNQRQELTPPKPPVRRKVLRILLPLLVICAVILTVWAVNRPKAYDGVGEVIYTDEDGTYQLAFAWPNDRYAPITEVWQNAEEGVDYRFPLRLYINHKDSGADAGQMFLQKVESVTAECVQPENSPSPWVCSEPAPHAAMPDAALITLNDFTAESGDTEEVWTIRMKNGDIITLRAAFRLNVIPAYHYGPGDAPMDTTEDLQNLIDQVSEMVEPEAVVYLHLPAVTYEGGLVIGQHAINLCGNTEGEGRTTFTGNVRVTANTSINYFDSLDFVGSGAGVGLSAAARVHVTNCSFTGWKAGVLAYGNTWVNVQTSHFEDNGIGFHFNAEGVSVTHTQYTGNEFVNNDTAILLESVPSDVTMHFAKCLFEGNGVDIDNRCDQSTDISQAIFQ